MQTENIKVHIREAKLEDVDIIHDIMHYYVVKGDLLPRTKEDIIDHIRNFIVAEIDGKVVGCMAIKLYSKELVEFRTLVVKQEYQNLKIGKRLVEYGLDICQNLGVKRVFVLTRVSKFFEKLGFVETKKEIFPEKVWYDCLLCPKLENCDEIAMVKKISD